MSMQRVPGPDNLYIGGSVIPPPSFSFDPSLVPADGSKLTRSFSFSVLCLRRPQAMEHISHVVSVMREKVSSTSDSFRDYHRLHIPINDMTDENLLEHFPACNRFIHSALAGGGSIFVHCVIGKSRSASVVLAYLLVRHQFHPELEALTPETALALLREARPLVEPNSGFWGQLQLYHRIILDAQSTDIESHPSYQRWLFQKHVTDCNAARQAPFRLSYFFDRIPESNMANITDTLTNLPLPSMSDPSEKPKIETQSSTALTDKPLAGPGSGIRCRMCRRALAPPGSVINHTPRTKAGPRTQNSPSNPDENDPRGQEEETARPCAHIFVEPLSWMESTLDQGLLEGKFHCPNPKCKALVGRYAWQGLRCSCDKWVVPGLSLGRAKVDDVKLASGNVGANQDVGPGDPSPRLLSTEEEEKL
ncbi:MAG: tyrosine protein phosphatase yvh1 [Vezdaea aestivalis]|nr:MAG: tyrosine protein phosphatase yvh1 [Vezdaea aestivalis]